MKKSILQGSKIVVILGIIFSIFVISCGKNEPVIDTKLFRTAQLENIYDNEISIATDKFITVTEKFKLSILNLREDISLENIETSRDSWKNMVLVWKKLELYNIGPIKSSFIFYNINYWPTNTDFVENFISGTKELDKGFIKRKGGSSKGVSALEYLLFEPNDQSILNNYTTNENSARRMDYLVAIAENMSDEAVKLKELWSGYETEFKTSVQDGLDGSQNLLMNQLVSMLEEIKIYKLEKSLGTKKGNIIDKEKLEAFRSKFSLELLIVNLQSVQQCFTGNFTTDTLSKGFEENLIALEEKALSIDINNSFTKCFEIINGINNPLIIELVNNKQNIIDLRDEVRTLIKLVKVEMAFTLNTTITFNDNDGD